MTHDYSHCFDFKDDKCPPDCFRAKLEKDLNERRETFEDSIVLTYAHFIGSSECKLKGERE